MSCLLLSVDLEDVRDWVENGLTYSERVPDNTRRYLDFFDELEVKATFFVVGRVARRYPNLIREIRDRGHEIACHGDSHLQLDKLTVASFKEDLEKNIQSLMELGVEEVTGFRAPTFSLTANTAWAYGVLSEAGIRYSSSVLPAKNPLYGWPEFGQKARVVQDGVWEIPMSLHSFPGLRVPIVGGVYFRVLPFFLTRISVGLSVKRNRSVGSYLHPYDIDCGQERFMHPDLSGNKYLNILMYVNRKKVLKRLQALHGLCGFSHYRQYVDTLRVPPATFSASGSF